MTEREIGPAFRYSHRNTVERLQDKVMKDPISSELIIVDGGRQSPARRGALGQSFDANRYSQVSPRRSGQVTPKLADQSTTNQYRGVHFAGDDSPKQLSGRPTPNKNSQFR